MSIDIAFWFKELFLTYKYGEKEKYERALKMLDPYLEKNLKGLLYDVFHDSLWLPFNQWR